MLNYHFLVKATQGAKSKNIFIIFHEVIILKVGKRVNAVAVYFQNNVTLSESVLILFAGVPDGTNNGASVQRNVGYVVQLVVYQNTV